MIIKNYLRITKSYNGNVIERLPNVDLKRAKNYNLCLH